MTQAFLHATFNGHTPLCGAAVTLDRDSDDLSLPVCPQCHRLYEHFARQRRAERHARLFGKGEQKGGGDE